MITSQMKTIKTYEGFFDFLKKKKKSTEPIYFDDIKECLLDLTEDLRVRGQDSIPLNAKQSPSKCERALRIQRV